MNTKSSKKIVPATVFAAIIVLLAFAVMCMTVSATNGQYKLEKVLDPDEDGLGTVVNVTIDVKLVGLAKTVTVVDTLPEEFTYIVGTFTVNDNPETPTVDKRNVSYTLNSTINPAQNEIEFDIKVTKAYWDERDVENVVVGTWYNASGGVIEEKNATANFTIYAFDELYKEVVDGPTEPVIGEKAEWTLGMGLTENPFGYIMTDTKITDRFGGDLMIDNITANTTTYEFTYNKTNYGTKQANVTIETFESGVSLGNITSDLDKTGVTIGAVPYEFDIFWTGRAHKAHFAWTIGALGIGNDADITIGVSTDTNPAGHQEYTSSGEHELNSGATLKFIDPEQDMQLSAVTDSIKVVVP